LIRKWLNCDGKRVGDFYPQSDIRLDYGWELDYPTIVSSETFSKLNRVAYILPLYATIPNLHSFVLRNIIIIIGSLFDVVLITMKLVPPEIPQRKLIVGHFLFPWRGRETRRTRKGKHAERSQKGEWIRTLYPS
jgi:hypothetical protein